MEELVEVKTDAGLLHTRLDWLLPVLEWCAVLVEILAILVMLIGVARYLNSFLRAEFATETEGRLRQLHRARVDLGRYVLAGLELFIVTDIIYIAMSLKLSDLFFLGLLVVIRTIVSYFLDREIRELKEDEHL